MKATLGATMRIPISLVDVRSLRKTLSLSIWKMGAREAGEAPEVVHAYTEDDGVISVPRQFGAAFCRREGIGFVDRTTEGDSVVFPTLCVSPREHQVSVINRMVAHAQSSYGFVMKAHTGSGKTVMSLITAFRLGVKTLIIVDQENLMDQWYRDNLLAMFGLSENMVGKVQGKVCDYKGKIFVVAMIQTLFSRKLPQEFYDSFGCVILDEAHVVAAPVFSTVLSMFPARYRFGVSATPKRGDSLQRMLEWHVGTVDIVLEAKHEASRVYYLESDTVYSWYANISPKTGRILTEVAEDAKRNELICRAIIWLYETGRDVLVVSDRIEQLENLSALAVYSGIPRERVGLYTGFRNVYTYEKDPRPARRIAPKGVEYTPVHLVTVRKRVPKTELASTKTRASIIFATYAMFSKGVDEPRLAAGIDCTPRSKAEQVHGRILRVAEDKLSPIWVTIRDINSYRVEYQFANRLREYVKSNAEVFRWNLDKGVKRQNVQELIMTVTDRVSDLSGLRITTQPDGRNTLETPGTQIKPEKQRGTPTGRRTR